VLDPGEVRAILSSQQRPARQQRPHPGSSSLLEELMLPGGGERLVQEALAGGGSSLTGQVRGRGGAQLASPALPACGLGPQPCSSEVACCQGRHVWHVDARCRPALYVSPPPSFQTPHTRQTPTPTQEEVDEFFDARSLLGSLQQAFSSAMAASLAPDAGEPGCASAHQGLAASRALAMHDLAASVRQDGGASGRRWSVSLSCPSLSLSLLYPQQQGAAPSPAYAPRLAAEALRLAAWLEAEVRQRVTGVPLRATSQAHKHSCSWPPALSLPCPAVTCQRRSRQPEPGGGGGGGGGGRAPALPLPLARKLSHGGRRRRLGSCRGDGPGACAAARRGRHAVGAAHLCR
jgi:hypothetical protein